MKLEEMAQTVRARRGPKLPAVLSVAGTQRRLVNGTDLRQVQELLSDQSIETTMIYTHVVREFKTKVRSPLDDL